MTAEESNRLHVDSYPRQSSGSRCSACSAYGSLKPAAPTFPTSLSIVAAVGDFSRFRTPEKLVAYLGLNPKVRQSGGQPESMVTSPRSAQRTRAACWSSLPGGGGQVRYGGPAAAGIARGGLSPRPCKAWPRGDRAQLLRHTGRMRADCGEAFGIPQHHCRNLRHRAPIGLLR